jgi:hypothetical protein
MTNGKEPASRLNPCWISSFIEYTADAATPEIFKKWTAISTIAGAMGRRVWVRTRAGIIYPNMFILLVAPPGVGKDQVMLPARHLLSRAGTVPLSPVAMSAKGLIDELADPTARKQFVTKSGFESYHTLYCSIPEFGVLVKGYDLEFMSILNELYNCGPEFKERLRMQKEPLRIDNPHLHILAGTQPKFIGSIFPEEAYGMGFTARIIMVYAGSAVKPDLWGDNSKSKVLEESLIKDLRTLDELSGEFHIEDDAKATIAEWFHNESDADAPKHSKLLHYSTRRILHLFKISMVKSLSRSNSLIITKEDFLWAKQTLIDTERFMPEIFKEISTGSSGAELEEAFNFLYQSYLRNQKPVPESRLVQFLAHRVPVNQITYIINTMQMSKMIEDIVAPGGDYPGRERMWKPLALNVAE